MFAQGGGFGVGERREESEDFLMRCWGLFQASGGAVDAGLDPQASAWRYASASSAR